MWQTSFRKLCERRGVFMKKLVVIIAVVSSIATIIDVSDASASRGAAAVPMCAARTAVSCRRDGTAISKTRLPDHGIITAPGGVYKLRPGMEGRRT